MWRKMLQAKIHRATVTGADLEYEGSITIDEELLAASGLEPNQAVDIYDVTNGNRLETYIIPGAPGSGRIQVNGAACHLVHKGDVVIIAGYAYLDESEVSKHKARVVLVDSRNRIRQTANGLAGHKEARGKR